VDSSCDATLNAFNKAFVGLMGKENIGTPSAPAGLSAADMELFRQFALDIQFPPNPYRKLDDSLPTASVPVPGLRDPGNPASGESVFLTLATDATSPCVACHALPFGAAGGQLGGINPGDPSTAKAALFNGTADKSPHSDLKIPHLRIMWDKPGFVFGPPAGPFRFGRPRDRSRTAARTSPRCSREHPTT
jgi:hypothetical protein